MEDRFQAEALTFDDVLLVPGRSAVMPDQVDLSVTLAPGIGLVTAGHRIIINPGAVGQPRDGDPRASYGILNLDKLTFEYRRIPYPINETQERMRQLDFPSRLINRLSFGW